MTHWQAQAQPRQVRDRSARSFAQGPPAPEPAVSALTASRGPARSSRAEPQPSSRREPRTARGAGSMPSADLSAPGTKGLVSHCASSSAKARDQPRPTGERPAKGSQSGRTALPRHARAGEGELFPELRGADSAPHGVATRPARDQPRPTGERPANGSRSGRTALSRHASEPFPELQVAKARTPRQKSPPDRFIRTPMKYDRSPPCPPASTTFFSSTPPSQ